MSEQAADLLVEGRGGQSIWEAGRYKTLTSARRWWWCNEGLPGHHSGQSGISAYWCGILGTSGAVVVILRKRRCLFSRGSREFGAGRSRDMASERKQITHTGCRRIGMIGLRSVGHRGSRRAIADKQATTDR